MFLRLLRLLLTTATIVKLIEAFSSIFAHWHSPFKDSLFAFIVLVNGKKCIKDILPRYFDSPSPILVWKTVDINRYRQRKETYFCDSVCWVWYNAAHQVRVGYYQHLSGCLSPSSTAGRKTVQDNFGPHKMLFGLIKRNTTGSSEACGATYGKQSPTLERRGC